MSKLKVTVILEEDGQVVPGFPLIRNYDRDEIQRSKHTQADHGDATTFATLPSGELGTVQDFLVAPDQDTTVRLNGQTDRGIPVQADGFILGINCNITNAVLLSLNNNSGLAAQVRTLLAGT